MPDIELTTVPTETSLADSDELYFNDVSETPDAVNRITFVNMLGTALAALRTVFTAASSSAAASLQFHEDTDNGSNKITVTAPASIASDKTITLPDQTGTALVDSGGTLTGVWDAGGATSFEIPNDAAPTVNANGEIALDTTVADFSHGIIKYYGGEELALVALPVAELTTPTDGHVIAYNATNDEFELVAAAGGGIGGSTGATDNAILRADGTGGSTAQSSSTLIDDNGYIQLPTTTYLTPTICAQGDTDTGINIASTNIYKIGLIADGIPEIAYDAVSNQLHMGANSIGWRDNHIGYGGSTVAIEYSAAGVVALTQGTGGTSGGGAMQFTEMTAPTAPGANGVRIYAVDNGAGKTQLMALFNSGAAQQIAIEP